jgi:hypothetical protein
LSRVSSGGIPDAPPRGLRRVPTRIAQCVPLQQAFSIIDAEDPDRRLADFGERDNADAIRAEAEVVAPSVTSWVEEPHEPIRTQHYSRHVTAFISVAKQAGES